MQSLSSSYLIELATQLGFLSAFLGGFAATFLVTIVVADSSKRITNWIIGSTALSACGFIVAVISFVMISIVLHPDAPINAGGEDAINKARIVSFSAFFIGILMLLISVGLSGWLRSKRIGKITSSISFLAILLVLGALSGF